eukprot:scaffold1706_cov29-Tisochrysis_lutea.AAC.3
MFVGRGICRQRILETPPCSRCRPPTASCMSPNAAPEAVQGRLEQNYGLDKVWLTRCPHSTHG